MDKSYTLNISKKTKPLEWNKWVSESPDGSLFQTTYWADRLIELLGYEPRYLTLHNEHNPEPVALLLYFRTGYKRLYYWQKPYDVIALLILKRIAPVYLWHGGPVVLSGDPKTIILTLLSEVERLAKAERVVRIEPSELTILNGLFPLDNWSPKMWATYRVDLQLDKETLWRNLKNSARKAIRRAERDGVTVREISSLEELRDYYDFTEECAKRLGKRMYGFEDIATMWKHFRTNAIYETFVAYHGEQKIAGLSIWGFNGIISELGSFQSAEAYEKKLYGQDLIKWEVIRWGHQQGFRWFDLAGVNPNPQTPKERGIRQFKEKWGGKYVEYPIVSKEMTKNDLLLKSFLKVKRQLGGILRSQKL